MNNSLSNKMTKSLVKNPNVVQQLDCSKMDVSVINDPRELHGRYQRCCPYTRTPFGTFKSKTPVCKQMDKKFKELMNARYVAPSEVQYGYLKENGDPLSNEGNKSLIQPGLEEGIDLTSAIIGGIKMKRKMTKKRKSQGKTKSLRNKKSFKKRKQNRKKRSRKTNK